VAVAGSVLPACSSVGAPASTGKTSLAADFLLGGGDERDHLWRESYVQRCMKDEGFDYTPAPFDPGGSVAFGSSASRTQREQYGYGISIEPPDAEQPIDQDANSNLLAGMSSGEREQFLQQADRCRADASAELERRRAELASALDDNDRALVDATLSPDNPIMRTAGLAWGQCMADLGWEYANQQQLIEQLESEWQTVSTAGASPAAVSEFNDREKRIALDDADCDAAHLASARVELLATLDEQLDDYDITIYGS
jgi:hypothetical protein